MMNLILLSCFAPARVLALAFALFASVQAASARVWTDLEGRTVEADLLEVKGDEVTIKRARDGAVASVPIERLSDADVVYLKEFSLEREIRGASWAEEAFAGLDWPRRTRLPDDYDVEVVREDNQAEVYIYRTPNFEFQSEAKLARKVVREFGRIFEGTLSAMQAFPLNWEPTPREARYRARLFRDRAAYLNAGGPPNSGGVYKWSEREIWVPLSSLGLRKGSTSYTFGSSGDRSTLIHEITHQVHHDWLGRLLPWCVEGLAVYMESIPEDDGEFRFDKQDLPSFVRRMNGPGEVTMVDPSKLFMLTHSEWTANFSENPAELRTYYLSAFLLLHYFLHLDGEGDGQRIRAYIRAIEAGEPEAAARGLLLDGRDPEEFFENLRRAYKRENIEIAND